MWEFELVCLLKLCLISIIQSQKYLECTFDRGDLPCKLIPIGITPPLQTISYITVDDPSVKPSMPLSDVTSITAPTIGNNLTCQIPYQLEGATEQIYFCSRSKDSSKPASCITTDSTDQKCLLGQYVLAQLLPGENLAYFIEVQSTRGPSCLSFYYYITNSDVAQILVRYSDITGSSTEQIGKVSKMSFNGWHWTNFSFQPQINDYHINFNLQTSDYANKTVFIALDEIKIIDGYCESDTVVTSTTTMDQTTQMTSQKVTSTTEESSVPWTQTFSTVTTSTVTTTQLSSETSLDLTNSTITVSSTTSKIPFRPLFQCDFTTICFGKNLITLTNGSEFNPTSLSSNSEPPRAPTSDITSITRPTNNNQLCAIPYRPPLDDSTTTTSWNMWFCYKNQCPLPNGQTAVCTSGFYGLISLDSSEKSKTVIDPLVPDVTMRDASGDQCLRFYYYFTVYDDYNRDQHIQLWIRPNNHSNTRYSIGNLAMNDMRYNGWHFHYITFKRQSSADTLQFDFAVANDSQADNILTNRTIYFALDNIELYDYNCSFVNDQFPQTTTSLPITSTRQEATPPLPINEKPNLGLILGLSLGVGIPVVLLAVSGVSLYVRKRKDAKKLDFIEMDGSICEDASDDGSISLSNAF
ncbi:unnamed protein product [Adineta ricciae]|uniref:MAM domain-containing protein n=1 Tax=Adineta ricciae TaxID=249248 RepID=A0A815VPT8_ADIRI|nr:unnamed protein product [Adineta ricciae]